MKKERLMIAGTLSENLRLLAAYENLTKADVARKLNMSPARIGHYFNGKRVPDIKTAIALAKLFNVTIDQLIGFDRGTP